MLHTHIMKPIGSPPTRVRGSRLPSTEKGLEAVWRAWGRLEIDPRLTVQVLGDGGNDLGSDGTEFGQLGMEFERESDGDLDRAASDSPIAHGAHIAHGGMRRMHERYALTALDSGMRWN